MAARVVTVKSGLSGHSKRRHFKTDYRLLQVKSIAECSKRAREHSAILSTFIKLPFVFKTYVLSILSDRFSCNLKEEKYHGQTLF